MLDSITQDVLIKIFGYLDHYVLTIPLISSYFRDYFNINKNYICNEVFRNNRKKIDLHYAYIIYKSIVYYDIILHHNLSDSDAEDSDETYEIYDTFDYYLYESVSDLLISDKKDAIEISISIIKFALQDFDVVEFIYKRVQPSIIFRLMELLLTNNLKSDIIDTDKKLKLIKHLVDEH